MILEREPELAVLAALLDDLEISGGHVALVRGEAGIGKSALVDRLVVVEGGRAQFFVGRCDDLLTPQPLGAVWDVARHAPPLTTALSGGDRRAVMELLLGLLSRPERPTVLIIEDTQWADEATLDAITFLGRRIARTNGLLVLTYRDAELDDDGPLRQVIGALSPQRLLRLALQPLSAQAIAAMVGQRLYDPAAILALTGGNPLFVNEVITAGMDAVPASVKDAVLARAAKLSPDARRLLQLVAVVPGRAGWRLVERLVAPTPDHISECV